MLDSLKSFLNEKPLVVDVLVVLAGAIYALGFSPYGWWPVVPVSLAVLMLGVSNVDARRGAWRFYLHSVGLYGIGVSWIYVSIHEHGGASALLAGFLVLAFVLSFSLLAWIHGWLFMRLIRHAPFGMVLGFPFAWMLREWVFTWILTGFPWLFAGYAPMDTWLGGYARVVGVIGLGLVVSLQASLVAWFSTAPGIRRGAVCVSLFAAFWLGGWVLTDAAFVKSTGRQLTVSAVQGNIDQDVKWEPEMIRPILVKYLNLSGKEWGRDLIVWPEAAVTLFREQAGDVLAGLDALGKRTGSTLVLGIPDESESGRFLNTAVAIGMGHGTYIKRRLVPFGEYVPMEGLLRGLIDFFDLPMANNESGPWQQYPLYANGLKLSVSICYEVVYPELVRTTVDEPDLFITISNDTWFGHSIGPWQHFQMARMRALENGRYLVRTTNNGVTGVIDPHGKVVSKLPQFEAGVLRSTVEVMSGQTPYARLGLGPLLIVVLLAVTAMVLSNLRHVSEQPIR